MNRSLGFSTNAIVTLALLFVVNIGSAQAPQQIKQGRIPSQPSGSTVTISATETATFPNHGDAYARQGDVISYTATISATGSNDATGVQFTNPTPANTTDVAGSLNATPVALDDTYPQTVQANMTVNTATSGFTVVTNDYPGILAGNPVALSALTITTSGTSANGGIVTMTTSGANVGRFTYAAPPGFVGTDTFTYTISNGVAGTPAGSATGTVSITVAGPVIWFVDDSAPGGGNGTWTGTNSKAFQTVTQAAIAIGAATNHRIYLASGTYTNGRSLKVDEWIVGEGASGTSFDTVMGITYGTDTVARPAINGTKPAWTAAAGSNVVFLANNNTILGVAITGSTVTAVQGTSVTTGLIGNATTTDVTITSGASGTGGCFALSGGSGAFNMNATISSTVGRSVSISGRGAGVVTFSRAITDIGTGIFLDNNDQSGIGTITFTGGLSLSTGANTAFTATNGGIVNATQDNTTIVNTLTTTTGTALNVTSTTIGASGLTFRSISSDGGGNAGIILNTTGSSGGLTVTGNGGSCTSAATCTGGSIINKAGAGNGTDGVFLNSATNVSLTRMNISDNNGNGIFAGAVNGIKIDNCFINSNADNTTGNDYLSVGFNNEGNVHLVNVSGTAIGGANPTSITNSTITNAFEHDIEIDHTTGTLTDFQINNSTVSNNGASTQAAMRVLIIVNGGTATLTVQDCTVTGNTAAGALTADGVSGTVAAGTLNAKVFRNTIQNHGDAGIDLSTSTTGILNFDVSNNGGAGNVANNGTANGIIEGSDAVGINIFANANSTGSMNGFIRGNTVGREGVPSSGSRFGRGIQIQNEAGMSITAQISGNIVQQINTTGNQGINVQHGIAAPFASGTSNITITNNTLRNITNGSRPLNVEMLNGGPSSNGVMNVSISGHTFIGNTGQGGGASLLRVNEGPVGNNNPTLNVTQLTPTAAVNANELDDANGLSFAGGQVTVAGAPTFGQPPPTLPTAFLTFAPGGVEHANVRPNDSSTRPSIPIANPVGASVTTTAPAPVSQPFQAGLLKQAELDSVVATAIARWGATGLSSEQLANLRKLHFQVAALSNLHLGEASGYQIRVSSNAGGNGWFIDARARSDAFFAKETSLTRSYTDPAGAPAGRIDLLTAIMHEMGHALGLNDSYLEQDRDSLMYGYLTKGERRLPAKNQAAGAKPTVNGATHFLASPVVIGTLPAGKGIKITFQNTIAAAVPTITSQGTVSGTNFSNVLTDDPGVGGTADPTVVQVAIPPTSFSAASPPDGLKNAVYSGYTFIANGNPAPTYTMQSGTFPPGLNLSTAGALSGTPTTSGLFSNLVVRATNVAGSLDTSIFDIAINDPPAFTSANNTTFTVGSNGNFQLSASGFPTSMTFTNTGNALPSGVTLSSGGLLSGTPDPGTGGTYNLTFQASNGIAPDGTQSFTLTVNQAPQITSANSTTFTEGNFGSFTATATGFPAPTLSATGTLPNAVTFVNGLLSGTPDAGTAGNYPIEITADNDVGSNATQNFTLTVAAAVCTAPPSGMVSWWAADGNAIDLLGEHDGTLMVGATANAAGKVAQGFTLNGTTDYVSIAGGPIVAGEAAFTIDAWFKTTSGSGFEPIYSESHTTDGNPFLYAGLLNGKVHFTVRGTGLTMSITSTLSYNDGLFHLAAFVKRADNDWELFVDGQSVGTSTTAVGTLTLNRSEIGRFGQAAGPFDFFAGQIDEVELFNLALSQPQIQPLYDASIAGKCSPPLQLSSAVSRKTHGAAGTFDVNLPLTGTPGIECRDSGDGDGNHTLVFTFTNAVVSGSASVTTQSGGSVSGSPSFAGKTMTVNLTGVTNAQQITVKLSNVTDAIAQVLPDTTVSMIALVGDTTANKLVNSTDVVQTKQQSGAPVNGAVGAGNFRNDVTVNGLINSTDINLVKARSGTGVP